MPDRSSIAIPKDEKSKASKDQFLFQNGHRLRVAQEQQEQFVELSSRTGEVWLRIEMKENGPLLKFTGTAVQVSAKEEIKIASPRIDIHATEELRLRSGGDFRQAVAGEAISSARSQKITAELGDVKIKANDNVSLNGERVKLNCTK